MERDCKTCVHDGDQPIYPSGCTGCGDTNPNYSKSGVWKIDNIDVSTEEYIELLETALVDVLEGQAAVYQIQENTGLPRERCKEINHFFWSTVFPEYKKKHK